MFGEFWCEIICFKGFFQKRQHYYVRHQNEKISLSCLGQKEEVFVQSDIVNDPLHPFEVTVVVLGNQVKRIRVQTSRPVLFTLLLIP